LEKLCFGLIQVKDAPPLGFSQQYRENLLYRGRVAGVTASSFATDTQSLWVPVVTTARSPNGVGAFAATSNTQANRNVLSCLRLNQSKTGSPPTWDLSIQNCLR